MLYEQAHYHYGEASLLQFIFHTPFFIPQFAHLSEPLQKSKLSDSKMWVHNAGCLDDIKKESNACTHAMLSWDEVKMGPSSARTVADFNVTNINPHFITSNENSFTDRKSHSLWSSSGLLAQILPRPNAFLKRPSKLHGMNHRIFQLFFNFSVNRRFSHITFHLGKQRVIFWGWRLARLVIKHWSSSLFKASESTACNCLTQDITLYSLMQHALGCCSTFPTLKQNLTQILCSFTDSILNATRQHTRSQMESAVYLELVQLRVTLQGHSSNI
jgi:hypothetical protein